MGFYDWWRWAEGTWTCACVAWMLFVSVLCRATWAYARGWMGEGIGSGRQINRPLLLALPFEVRNLLVGGIITIGTQK